MKHTPGPWNTHSHQIAFGTATLQHYLISAKDKLPIAETYPQVDDEQEEANARLIAAAPDLLTACEQILNAFVAETNYRFNANLYDYMVAIEAAIKKAKGEQ